MKYALAILLALSPVTAHAGLLFGSSHRTTIINQGAPVTGYSMRYSSEGFPPYRTFRSYRGSVQSGYLVPAPATYGDSASDIQHQLEMIRLNQLREQTMRPLRFGASVDDAPATTHKERHKERHRHGKRKSSTTTTIRSTQ